jgi:Alginate export
MKKGLLIATSLVALAVTAQDAAKKPAETTAPKKDAAAPAETVVKEKSLIDLDGGFDLRARYDMYDNLPNSDGAISRAYAGYYRQRTRVWGSAYTGNYGVYLRLANEFREYNNYDPSINYNRFPDQLFVDNIYLDFKNLLYDRVDLRIGRQDLKYGAGRVIADGTPSDGSRSEYFDAIKLTIRVTDKTSGDFFAMYTKPVDNFLTIGDADGQNYNITSYDGAVGPGKDDDLTEWGIGTYWTIKEVKECPLDLYALYKDESDWHKKGKQADTIPGRQYVTVGARLTPQFTDNISGELEGAYQFGRTSHNNAKDIGSQAINAYMLYGGLSYKTKETLLKPYVTLATLYLSGDDKGSKYNSTSSDDSVTGWSAPHARTTLIGELPVKMYGSSYRWSNLIWPHIEPGFEPFKGHKFKLQTGPMFADKNDYQDDAKNDLYRGWYTQAKYEATLLKEIVGKRGAVKAALQLEHMAYGDYYDMAGAPDNGYFARIEVSMSF